ncbi:YdcF family protein [Pseudodesulfovibrio sp.]|uniref:YdcF family protein n=1 Tax=Pseudodesulfovibrio sp. TaxID=2035812 RepID=UPI00261FF79A|nr:YdcF family protein [Pseudodesulfovibrio sp.]MDD3310709.1 YdcF family protein [Pseudodesulfovibrio sp.]
MLRLVRLFLQCVGTLTILSLLVVWGLLAYADRWMRVNDQPVKSDYILPLAGDPHRWITAADLYSRGYAPVILESMARRTPPSRLEKLYISQGRPNYTFEQRLAMILNAEGVPNARLEPFGNGHISTREEAEALRDHLRGRTVSLLIVTSPYHARRARMIFRDVLPDCRITMVSTKEGSFWDAWWKDQDSAQLLVMEFAKTVYYLLGGVYRSTDVVSPAQATPSGD